MHAISAGAHHRMETVAQGNEGCFDNNLGFLGIKCTKIFMKKRFFYYIHILHNNLIFACPVFSSGDPVKIPKIITAPETPRNVHFRAKCGINDKT